MDERCEVVLFDATVIGLSYQDPWTELETKMYDSPYDA